METPSKLSASPKIVFDTNILISAFVFKQLTSVVYQYCAERYELYTTEWMLNELHDVLGRKKFRLPETIQNDILDQVRSDAQVITPTNTLPTDSSDPDDNNLLQAALFINADFLITGDEKHLLILGKVGNTEIISPRAFYEKYIA